MILIFCKHQYATTAKEWGDKDYALSQLPLSSFGQYNEEAKKRICPSVSNKYESISPCRPRACFEVTATYGTWEEGDLSRPHESIFQAPIADVFNQLHPSQVLWPATQYMSNSSEDNTQAELSASFLSAVLF